MNSPWLCWQFILSNKLFLFTIFSPILYMTISVALGSPKINASLIGTGINLIYSYTAGTFASTTISEEKEKKNLKALILSGVRQGEYILSVVVFPLLFSLISNVLVPVIIQVQDMDWGKFSAVMSLTNLIFVLLNLLITFLAKNQTRTTVCSFTLVIITSFLPLFSEFIKSASKFMNYSFIGASAKYFKELSSYQLTDQTVVILLIWIFLTSITLYSTYKKNREIG